MSELTEKQVRDQLLEHFWDIITHWEKSDGAPTTRDKLAGVVFSVLAALDGSSINIPRFIVAPSPHEEDKGYRTERGEDYFPENNDFEVVCNLGGSLHEHWHNRGRELGHIKSEPRHFYLS